MIQTDPTKGPTSTPTSVPTRTPTMGPTTNTACTDYTMQISFRLMQYLKVDGWEDTLTTLSLQAFKQTIIDLSTMSWNNTWCVNIDITFTELTNRRMLLQDQSDIDCYTTFIINELLFNDYFNNYNQTAFMIGFHKALASRMGIDPSDFQYLDVAQPVKIDPNTPRPTPLVYQKLNEDSDKTISIMIASIIFGICCFFVLLWLCKVYCNYEKETNKGYEVQQTPAAFEQAFVSEDSSDHEEEDDILINNKPQLKIKSAASMELEQIWAKMGGKMTPSLADRNSFIHISEISDEDEGKFAMPKKQPVAVKTDSTILNEALDDVLSRDNGVGRDVDKLKSSLFSINEEKEPDKLKSSVFSMNEEVDKLIIPMKHPVTLKTDSTILNETLDDVLAQRSPTPNVIVQSSDDDVVDGELKQWTF